MKRLLLCLLLLLPLPLSAAINPDVYVSAAPEHLQLREISRIVQVTHAGDAELRRVTLVAEVIDDRSPTRGKIGSTIVIDYTVDLSARERAARDHAARAGNRPGPQFMHEPDPPVLDDTRTYWAHLAPWTPGTGDQDRDAGSRVGQDGYDITGDVYVPAAAQYSFER